MKTSTFLLMVLLALCLVLGWAWFTPPTVSAPAGSAHPDYPTMLQGGNGAERFAPVAMPALLFALLSVTLFVGMLALGIGDGERLKRARWHLLVPFVLFLLMFVMLFRSYGSYAEDPGATQLFLGFPAPSAWMLYGVWTVPFVFALLYVVRFKELIYSDEDEARFKALVEKHGASGSSEETG